MLRLTEDERRQRAGWRRRWRAVPHDAQRAINHSLSKGVAVDDPALASLAMEVAARRLGWIRTRGMEGRPQPQRLVAAGCAVLAIALLVGADETFDYVFGAIWLILAAISLGAAEWQRRLLMRGYAANARVVEAHAAADDAATRDRA